MTAAADHNNGSEQWAKLPVRFMWLLFSLALAAGVGLRAYQYLMGRSLWPDECHLALNFIQYDLWRLMRPLDHIQAAPVLFIILTKMLTGWFGYGELVFRAVPFVLSVLTLPLFFFVVRQITGNATVALISFITYALNLSLIYFSAEFKAYGVDAAMFVLILYLAVSGSDFVKRRRTLLLAVAGCIAILLSSVSFVGLFAVALYRLASRPVIHQLRSDLAIYLPWLIVFALNYFLFIHNHPATGDQRLNYSFAFCPVNIFDAEFYDWMARTINETFFSMLLLIEDRFGFRYYFYILFIAGVLDSFRRDRRATVILCGAPVLLHLLMSALHLYPFWYRLILYLVPCFIVFAASGAFIISNLLAQRFGRWLSPVLLIICTWLFSAPSVRAFPKWPIEIKPALEFANKHQGKHKYLFDPVNAYRYYHYRGFARDSVYMELPWELTPEEFYEFTSNEKDPIVLIYGVEWQWGYGDVLEDLRRKALVQDTFERRGYGVMVVQIPQSDTTGITLNWRDFDKAHVFDNELIAVWSGTARSREIRLGPGRYHISVSSKGTQADGVYPVCSIHAGDQKLGEFTSTHHFSTAGYPLELASASALTINFTLLNDFSRDGQDRNTFIRKVVISRQE